ncbi:MULTISPECIES: hypothetical protein [Bartonella]|uniref:hypothetical protein n=1 Tax=Bartonella TaxID=773 RepID=UPI0018DB7317|nr:MULTISPECIES: hypothetical protein [Bartonella]MBH9995467.1 hypothetical protein [Bartonella sp. P0291]MBH9996189.1 hypothetical protein [Bartonella sp. M0192]MBH9998350.1 hypothetical protein [Bartonella sp. M0191]MBI0009051.1 hypothetical protein [Bartonella sp. M0193]MBI0009640.1 hypothetical protein [Bartonella sp. M0176]
MPTLTRLFIAFAILVALVYAAMVGLVYIVKPVTTDITIEIQPENLHLRDRSALSPVSGSQVSGDEKPANGEVNPKVQENKRQLSSDQNSKEADTKPNDVTDHGSNNVNLRKARQTTGNLPSRPETPDMSAPSNTKKDNK